MDPAALGNTLIGLDAVHREQSLDGPPRTRSRRHLARRTSAWRVAVAAALRAVADAIDARPRERAHGT